MDREPKGGNITKDYNIRYKEYMVERGIIRIDRFNYMNMDWCKRITQPPPPFYISNTLTGVDTSY